MPASATTDKRRQDESGQISLGTKFLLNAAMLGNESSLAFITLMSVPVLQSLGAPLEYVSILYIFQGAAAAVLIPIIGVVSDGGPDPRVRKIPLVLLSNSISLVGGGILIAASFMRISTLGDYTRQISLTNAANTSQAGLLSDSSSEPSLPFSQETTSATVTPTGSGSDVTSTAILGMLAYAVLELGYDTTNSCVKACVVTCTPRAEQTSVLLLGLLVAALGGCCTALMGSLDLTALLPLETGEESNTVLLQASAQVTITMVMIVLGTLCTLATARFRLRTTPDPVHNMPLTSSPQSLAQSSSAQAYGTFGSQGGPSHTHEDPAVECARVCVTGGGPRDLDGDVASKERRLHDYDQLPGESSQSDPDMLVSKVQDSSLCGDCSGSRNSDMTGGDVEYTYDDVPLYPAEKSRVEDDQSGRSTSIMARFLRAVTEKSGRNLVLVCVATFFATGVMQGFNMFIADFLGKEVFKGQPLADPGSDMTAFYDQGVRLASRGTLISFVSFGLVNLFNARLLKHIGLKKEFVSVHVLFAASLLWMVSVDSVLAFHVNAAIVGIQRSLTYSLPFVVANDYSHQVDVTGEKRTVRVGTAIAIMSSMLPLSNCALYSWFGPLAAYAGPAAPMYASVACAIVAAGCFLSYGHL
ncbi:hypothetical protein BaRGS_00011039 [Batillaria attramentaria]|uniref:Uncharacterized protein n=1 Tax=Batillaria attramentaria TaxID=370345 RepID=A0ABD0LDU6_9CAEN